MWVDMSFPGRLLIITPILMLIGTATFIISDTLPELTSMMDVEMTSAYAIWCEAPKQYRYRTMLGIDTITLKDFWEINLNIKNIGKIPTTIQEIFINKKPVDDDVIVLTKKADSSVYDALRIGIDPDESVTIIILITKVGGDFIHGNVIEIGVKLQTRQLNKLILLP